ncbi:MULTISPECIES: DEAD/DEAH box helicase [unclassified Oceanobacillus]|uniref:DEAD/DEAH box helicase n=1 Tax=unclassified Oceanobacillus TaxID=2630292 RepID=UPI001BE7E3CA|nr:MULTISPECIES: DEAD/DEAH box helicase [unclassified Oceanobacillus]MBT2653432.1 DEAD/DEAH box helicase [Oceanobacillus sp. ISL-73]
MFQLHEYQQTLVDKTRQSYVDGYNAPCVVAPCGAGKSVIISDVARMTTLKGNRVLFLVHRKELIEQIEETFELNNVDMKLVQFGMVQTIVKRLDRTIKPDLIITDENHHGMAASYRKIYDHFHDVLRLGFTATPIRLNGSGLGDVNDILIEEVDAKWLIEHNYLSPYKYYAPKLIDITKLKLNSLREFSSTSIDNALDDNTIYGDVVKHYKELADGEQAIAYCHSIKASQLTAEQFNKNGINAIHLDGKTPKDEREEIIKKFRNKEISILCNVDLVGEGFNVPDCSTVIMLRPTQSLSLFIQQSMRGMRYKPDKTSIIIDHVDNVRRHGLPDMERSWSLECKKSSKKQQETEVKIKQCDSCFAVYSPEEKACPLCGHVPEVKERKDYEIEEGAELEEVKEEDIVLDFREPEDCKSMKELYQLAKHRNYKPGWAYHQGKLLGFI